MLWTVTSKRSETRNFATETAVATMESNVGKHFEKIRQKAEHARLAYQAARTRLHEHLASHGCA